MPSRPVPKNNDYDLETVTIRGSGKHLEKKRQMNGQMETQQKHHSADTIRHNKLENATDVEKRKTINPDIKNRIIQARTVQKIKQSDLAKKINVSQQVIQTYENGKATADIKILTKLQKILNVKLTGREFSSINV